MRYFLFFTLLLTTSFASAQTKHSIEGVVVDSLGQGVVGAVVSCSLDDQVTAATTSDGDGLFKMAAPAADSCVLKITHLQYQEAIQHLRLDKECNLGRIVLREQVNAMESVVVMADFIKRKGSDYTVLMRNNPVAVNHNTLSFLNTLPGVNGLQINGRGVSTVYVNGRKLPLPPSEIMQYLAGLQATDVEQITVMPSGGAKYAADHKGGVIRLQLRRGDDRLFSGSLTLPLGVNTEDGAISTDIPLTLNYTTKKLASYTFVSGSYMQNEPTENTYSLRDQTEHTNNTRTFYSFWGDQSLVYDINKKHSIGLAINAMIKPKESRVSEVQTELSRLNEMQTSRIDERTSHYQGTGVLTYQWTFDDRGSALHLVGDYLYRNSQSDMRYTPFASEVESTLSETNKHTISLEASSEINFGDDRSTLSLGANYLQMKAVQDYTQTAQPENQFRYREKIFSAYAEFSTSFADDKLDLAAGLRYEGAAIKWNYTDAEAGRMDSKDRFNDWFPSASLTYNMPSGKSYLTLEYERAISRPIMSDYDPAVFRESESVYIVGASHLLPEFEHVLSLTQTLNRMHTFSVSYTWNNDLYAEVYREQGDALVITSGNYGSSRTLQLFAQSRFWIVKNWLQGNVSGTANYVAFDHSTYGKTRSWEGRANAGLDLLLPKGWALGVSGYYATPTKTPIDRLSASWSLSAHVGKQIGPRCMLYLSGSNLLYNENLTITSRQPDVFFRNDIKNYFRKITLMFSCRFGSSKLSYVKRAQSSSDTKSRSSDNN